MADSDHELRFIITNKAHQYRGQLFAKKAHIELGWNRTSLAEFTIDADHRLVPELVADGARVRVLLDGVQEMAGLIETIDGTFPDGDVTVTVLSDFQMLYYMLAWPKPAAAIGSQTDEYRVYTGVSETVAKLAIAEANTRLGLGWTIAATGGKGTATRVETRFHPLPDKILDILTNDKLQLRVDRDEAGAVTVDVLQGATFDRTLTLDSAVLENGKWQLRAPTVTRAVIGGSGEGTARELAQYIDSSLETAWGIKREVFKDARSSEAGADLSTDWEKARAEGARKASLSTKLSEGAWWQYRNGYVLGDIVTIDVGAVQVEDQVISTVTIDEDPENGIVISPAVGEITDNADKRFAASIAQLARGTRDQGRR
jgi:hypothetical protein